MGALQFIGFVLLITMLFGVKSIRHVPAPKVTTTMGVLVGRFSQSREGRPLSVFLGIPYAKPPVGDLRFEPPQPLEPWPHERLAVTHPRRCVQAVDTKVSEDCLYLDVYSPETDSWPLLPVLVYFHGGFFDEGASADYTPEYLLDEDIVYVIIQYRLGLFGFLSTGDEVVPGNMALKDLRLGLRWVKDNINSFGGDPDKITIFGQSGGAVAVHAFMSYIADEGLFRAAISHSGTTLCPFGFRPPQEVRRMVDVLAVLAGCPTDSVGFVECLKAKSAEELLTLYNIDYKDVMYAPGELFDAQSFPLISPVLEPECVSDRIVTGNPWHTNTSIPWLVGCNSKEANFYFIPEIDDETGAGFTTVNVLFDSVFPRVINYQNSEEDGTLVPLAVREFYLKNQPISRETLWQSVTAVTDAAFLYGIYEAVLRADLDQTYMFYFDYLGPNQMNPISPEARVGASHSDELFFFFPHPGIMVPYPRGDSRLDYQLSKTLIKMWTNFVKCLDPTPSNSCSVQWEPFSSNHSYLHIKQDGLEMENHFLSKRMTFWQSQPFPFRNEEFGELTCRPDVQVFQLPFDI